MFRCFGTLSKFVWNHIQTRPHFGRTPYWLINNKYFKCQKKNAFLSSHMCDELANVRIVCFHRAQCSSIYCVVIHLILLRKTITIFEFKNYRLEKNCCENVDSIENIHNKCWILARQTPIHGIRWRKYRCW